MSDSESTSGDVFDLKKLRRLVDLMKEHDLCEVDLQQGEQKIRVRRGAEVSWGAIPAGASAIRSAAAASEAAPPPVHDAKLAVIKSPMVGTFYSASSPEAAPFVKVGDHVGPDTSVCIIEAMKVFNEIPAEVSGKIAAVLVKNGDPVEFGQPLFKVETST